MVDARDWLPRGRLKWSVLLLAVAGCGPSSKDAPPAVTTSASLADALDVSIGRPQKATLRREVSQPGQIQAFEETPVYAKVAGYVQKWNVDRGDFVKKDQVVAELWVPEMQVTLRQKGALVRQMEAEIQQAKVALSAAEASFLSAEAKVVEFEAKYQGVEARFRRVKSQADRFSRMNTVIDKENVEEAQLGFQTAKANLAEAEAAVKSAKAMQVESKAKWSKAEADVSVVETRLSVAREERDYAQTMLNYARLSAPYDGVVTNRAINRGDFVQPAGGDKVQPLYVVMRTDVMRVFVQVPEMDADWVHSGVTAHVRVQALPGREFTGSVTRIAWALDPATRTLLAEIDLPNRNGPLRPGMYAYATLTGEQTDRLTLPRSAIITEGDVTRGYQSYCYQVEDGKVHRLLLELGSRDGARIEVLRKRTRVGASWEPFTGAEEIVCDKLMEIRPGQAVNVTPRGR